jgi:phosphodiesterase/alkaline phosphatase D-like protein
MNSDVYVNLDAWDGYPSERTQPLQFIADQGLRNVVVCTGEFITVLPVSYDLISKTLQALMSGSNLWAPR